MIDFIVQREEEIGREVYSFQLKYAFEQAKERVIDIDDILFKKEANRFNERLLFEVNDINKDISKNGRYKAIRDFIQILRIFNGLVLFLSAIGAAFIGFSKPIMLIPSLVGMIVWFLILKAIGIGLELLSDIERNGRINLLLNIFNKSRK